MLTVFAFVHKSSHRGVSLSSLPPSVYLTAAFVVVVLVVLVVVCGGLLPLSSIAVSRRRKKTPDPNRKSDCAAILENKYEGDPQFWVLVANLHFFAHLSRIHAQT